MYVLFGRPGCMCTSTMMSDICLISDPSAPTELLTLTFFLNYFSFL